MFLIINYAWYVHFNSPKLSTNTSTLMQQCSVPYNLHLILENLKIKSIATIIMPNCKLAKHISNKKSTWLPFETIFVWTVSPSGLPQIQLSQRCARESYYYYYCNCLLYTHFIPLYLAIFSICLSVTSPSLRSSSLVLLYLLYHIQQRPFKAWLNG